MKDISRDIIEQAAEGDLNSFELIYKASSGFVYNLAFRITRDRQDSEEVTQDVFLKVYKSLDKYRFESSFKTWLYRIAVNAAINFYNKRKRHKEKVVICEELVDTQGVAPDVESRADSEVNENKIKILLSQLNQDQRVCVILRSIQGLSYEEIAQTLKININTVRSRLKRAREKMLAFARERGGNYGL